MQPFGPVGPFGDFHITPDRGCTVVNGWGKDVIRFTRRGVPFEWHRCRPPGGGPLPPGPHPNGLRLGGPTPPTSRGLRWVHGGRTSHEIKGMKHETTTTVMSRDEIRRIVEDEGKHSDWEGILDTTDTGYRCPECGCGHTPEGYDFPRCPGCGGVWGSDELGQPVMVYGQ